MQQNKKTTTTKEIVLCSCKLDNRNYRVVQK